MFDFNDFNVNIYNTANKMTELKISLVILIFMFLAHFIEYKENIIEFMSDKHVAFRWVVYLFLIFSIVHLGNAEGAQFIYFQF